MKKLNKLQLTTLRGIVMIIYGITIICIGIFWSGKWLISKHEEIYEKINLENFQGEIYNRKVFEIYPREVIEYPADELTNFIKNANKKSVFIYNDDINANMGIGVSTDLYIPDTLRNGRYIHIKKSYHMESGRFFLSYNNRDIIVTRLPIICLPAFHFFFLIFCLIYGFFKIKFNVERIKDELKYSKK